MTNFARNRVAMVRHIRFRLLALALCWMAWDGPANSGEKPLVAVFEIEENNVGIDDKTTTHLWDFLTARMAESGYRVIPLGDIRKRLRVYQRESYRHCYDQSCQIELGRELAAQKILATKIFRVGTECQFTALLIDLKQAATEKAVALKSPCGFQALLQSLDEVARRFSQTEEKMPEAALTASKSQGLPLALEQTAPNRRPNTWAHVSFWTGLAVAGFGATAMALSIQAANSYEDNLIPEDKDRSRTWAGLMWTGLGVGAVLMSAGVFLWLFRPEEIQRQPLNVRVEPTDKGASLLMWGRW